MRKITRKYIEELFNCIEESGYINAFRKEKNIHFELKENLGLFLDIVCACANKKDIPETHKTDKSGADNRFCYWIRFNGQIIEIGMFYDDVVYASRCIDEVEDEDVIDCNDILLTAEEYGLGSIEETIPQDTSKDKPSKKYGLKNSRGKKKKD